MQSTKSLREYFKANPTNDPEYWNTDLNCYYLSGFSILPDIVKLKPNTILDLGCGYNNFKEYFPNLIGIDYANEHADIVGDFLDYECKDESIDVVLLLGSINFGSFELVDKQMEWIVSKLKKGGTIFIRVNPARAPDDSILSDFYPWKLEDIYYFNKKYNLKIKDDNIKFEDRIYSDKIRGTEGFANVKLYWNWIKE